MIDQLKDFTIVKGQNQTSEKYWGDLQRIVFPQELVLTRPKSIAKVPYGIDMAWLQECCAQREWTLGRDVSQLSTFSVVPSPEPMQKVYECISSYVLSGGDLFLTQPPSVTCVFESWLSGSLSASHSLSGLCELEGLHFTLGSLEDAQPLSVPPYSAYPSYWRYGAIESLMERLGYAVPSGTAKVTSYVTKEISAGDFETMGHYADPVKGTRDLLDYAVIAHTEDGKTWKTYEQSYTATSQDSLLPVLQVSCLGQRFSTTLVPKRVELWAKVNVNYYASGSRTSRSGGSRSFFLLLKIASIAVYGVTGISRTMASAILLAVKNAIKDRDDFDMDPANFVHDTTTDHARYRVTVLGVDVLYEYKDTVTSPR